MAMIHFSQNIRSGSFACNLPVRETGRESAYIVKAISINPDPLHLPGDDRRGIKPC